MAYITHIRQIQTKGIVQNALIRRRAGGGDCWVCIVVASCGLKKYSTAKKPKKQAIEYTKRLVISNLLSQTLSQVTVACKYVLLQGVDIERLYIAGCAPFMQQKMLKPPFGEAGIDPKIFHAVDIRNMATQEAKEAIAGLIAGNPEHHPTKGSTM